MFQYYLHLVIVLSVALIWLADTYLLWWDSVPYEPTDRYWSGSIVMGSVMAMMSGPGVIHVLTMLTVIFLSMYCILFADYDAEKTPTNQKVKLGISWYMALFSMHSVLVY